MTYILTFLEGILAFISPCVLPMVPIYLSILGIESDKKQVIKNALSFILGFSVVFILMGAFSGSLGVLLKSHSRMIELVGGILIIIFGLIYLDVIKINFMKNINYKTKTKYGIISSLFFGMIFSIGWTPCVGAFLGSALTIAANSQSVLEGSLLLTTYSLGMGIPFILTAIFFEQLTVSFDFIKKHYGIITKISGSILILTGLLMITGLFNKIFIFLS